MPRIRILDERKYPLPIKNTKQDAALSYHRWEHRATLGRGSRVFMVFLDNAIIVNDTYMTEPKAYIEEMTSGHLKRIDDEQLFQEIYRYANGLGFLAVQMPIPKVES